MSELVNLSANITFDHASLTTAKANQQEAERTVRAVQYLNRTEFSPSNQSNSSLAFTYDQASNRPVVKVVDHATGNILYQMPAEEVLRMAADVRKREKLRVDASKQYENETTG